MSEPTIWKKLGVAAGLLLSFSALAWLLWSPTRPPEILPRVGFVSALFCSLGVLVFCWALVLAHVARGRNWSPKKCHLSGVSILAAVLGLSFFASSWSRNFGAVALVVQLPMITGYLCRKLTYPQLTEEEAHAPEPPLTLFPR
jgi:hypothetical protein